MNKTIFRSVLLACCIVMVFSLAVTLFFLNSYFINVEFENLRAQAELTARAIDEVGLSYFDTYDSSVYRITWVDSDGSVIYDTAADESTMENHLDRSEIATALTAGHGQARRLSDTLSLETLYSAVRISDGSVIRLSVTQASVLRITLGMIPYMFIVLALALVLCMFISKRISARVINPLNNLDLDNPLENDTYEELSPLLVRIDNQNRQIAGQIDTIRTRQKEFDAITNNMREGMIILNSSDLVVSMNTSAMKLFGGSSSNIGRNILTLERSPQFTKAMEEVKQKGRSEYFFERNGFVNRLIANQIQDDNSHVLGTCILIVDETEKVLSEGMRKEFSANVSHELKTPLHSNETKEFPREEVSLQEVAGSVVEALEQNARERSVTIEKDVDNLRISGVQRLVYEIIYNLCDNAIRYNREGGHVRISVHRNADTVELKVADDGIGIPSEHLARIFERFYRVDTSHSRSTGGTGLGLSIVKHAAMVLGGQVEVDSREGLGTTFTVSFPADLLC